MAKTEKIEKKEVVCNCKEDLKKFLAVKMPGMFDRDPNITGNLDTFADEIIKIVK